VNSSFVLSLENKKIISAKLAFGGVGPKAIRLSMVEKNLIGKTIDPSLIEETRKQIADSITPIADVRGSAEFRKLMAQDLFSKFAQEHLES
jgi:CO/xanthine dehydrogenase FAD-binding subunit